MTKDFCNKKYTIRFADGVFDVTLTPKSAKDKTVEFLVALSVIMFLIAVAAFFCTQTNYANAIIFVIFAIVVACAFAAEFLYDKKRENIYLFEVNSDGITHRDVGVVHQIKWFELVSFGYVNNNVIAGIRSDPTYPCQLCLYFSKNEYDEEKIRTMFDRIDSRLKKHISTERTIVFGFFENHVPQEIIDKINKTILLYCDSEKERTYIAEENLIV